ncbi:hypothetical protein CCHL11_09625 [Colletotrichum chlorophyti]|uniref:Oxidase ustYa n=1 Tax=Colletotrichum chlorophyti TaxID=708187 RepID=A0A1Q8S875_9PEZI|nr:hypothetical protein CCHL11_09625 [Colletotrichum chlorophyti]
MGRHSSYNEMGDCSDSSEHVSFLGQRGYQPRERQKSCRFREWLRVSLYASTTILNIAAVIVLASVYTHSLPAAEEASHAVPSFSREFVKFQPELEVYTLNYTSIEESAIVRQRWQDLLPGGGGDVHIPDHERYEHLSEPWLDPRGNELWKVAWAHQLHCLYLIMNDFDRVVRYGPTGKENEVEEGHFQVHTNHCFDYLRQSILCAADMTLEGKVMGRDAKPGTDGWGHLHTCRNHREVMQWIEERRVKDKKFIIDPGSPL